jgi:hypothetical protein
MNQRSDPPASPPAGPDSAEELRNRIRVPIEDLEALAQELEGQPEALLELLRRLEHLHRSIQDGPFRNSLPSDRNELFRLLEEMESSGGWPYIPRLQLRTFIGLLPRDQTVSPSLRKADSSLAV